MTISLRNWMMAFRPKTLTAALIPILVGTSIVFSLHKDIAWGLVLLALLSAFCIQIATNLVNDAVDFKKGADTHERLGPQRVTQSGVFSSRQVWIAAIFFLILAVISGLPLVFAGGYPILIVGLLSLFFAYGYTAGPWPLAYLGLGDLFVIIFFGFIAVGGFVFILLKELTWMSALAGLQVGLHAAVLIAVNNLRDLYQDTKVNKKTLSVRLGEKRSKMLIYFYLFSPYLLNLIWIQSGHLLPGMLPLMSLPLAIKMTKLIYYTSPSREYNRFLGMAAGIHLIFGLMLSLGFVIQAIQVLNHG